MEKHFDFGSRRISYNLFFKERKSLGVKVLPDTTVEVIAPESADDNEVAKRVRAKAPWIIKQQDYFNSFKPATPVRKFVNGETHLYLGRQYKLKVIPSETDTIKVYRGLLFVYTLKGNSEDIAKQLEHWYKQKANIAFNTLLGEILPTFKRYKIAETNIIYTKDG